MTGISQISANRFGHSEYNLAALLPLIYCPASILSRRVQKICTPNRLQAAAKRTRWNWWWFNVARLCPWSGLQVVLRRKADGLSIVDRRLFLAQYARGDGLGSSFPPSANSQIPESPHYLTQTPLLHAIGIESASAMGLRGPRKWLSALWMRLSHSHGFSTACS